MGKSSKKEDLVGIDEALDVVVATPPGAGRSCLGRWFSSSHRLLDAASAAALYRDFIMHYLLATPTWTRTWKASAAANRLARSRGRNTRPGPEIHRPLTPFGRRTAQYAFQH